MKFDKKFIEELNQFEDIYCLISGGYHSTTSALLLKDSGFKNVTLLHNNTNLEMRTSLKTIDKVIEITGFEFIQVIPHLKGTIWDLMKECFKKIPEVREDIKNGRYDRTKFKCCYELKKKPIKHFYNSLDKSKSVVINSLCPFESRIRRI